MKRTAALATLALLFGCGVSFFLFASRDPYQAAAHAGVKWLAAYPEEYGNPGVFWALKESTERYCKSDGFAKKLTERFESVPRSEAERAYFYFPEIPISEEMLAASTTARYDRWLLSALSCRERPLTAGTRNELALAETTGGYDLTHAYLAFSYVKHLGCDAEEASLDARIAGIEHALREEESRSGAFSDLSAERAALLLRNGRRDLVDDAWLIKIKSAQGPSGGWGDGAGAAPNPHTTALAAWALTEASGRCPL